MRSVAGTAGGSRARIDWTWWWVAGLAACVHWVYVRSTNGDPAFALPLVDGASYHDAAVRLLSGRAETRRPYWQPPLYTWWLTGVYAVCGTSPAAARHAQAAFSVGSALAAFGIARGRWGRCRWAAAAGAGAALCGPLVFFNAHFVGAGLGASLGACGVWAALRAQSSGRLRDWGLAGLLTGLGALAVANVLVIGASIFAWEVVNGCRGGARRLLSALSFGLCVFLCILPVSLRNWRVSGRFVLISTNAGINFFIGNNADRDRTLAIRPGLDWDRLAARPFRAGVTHDAAADRWFMRQALLFVQADPLAFLSGLWTKARQYGSGIEWPRNIDVYVCAERSRVLSLLLWRVGPVGFPSGLILPLTAIGILASWREARCRLLALCVLAYSASVVLFFVASRYRVPALPLAIPLACQGARSVVAAVRGGRWLPAGLAAGLVVACNLPVRDPYAGVNFRAELDNAVGCALETRGRVGEAMDGYRRALGHWPRHGDAHYNLANALRESGRDREAEASYRAALDARPDDDRAMSNLAVVLTRDGRIEEARALLEEAARVNPLNPRILVNLGVCRIQGGDPRAAVPVLESALALDPRNADALENLGSACYRLGRLGEAEARYREALSLDPDRPVTHNNLGAVLSARGQGPEAVRHFREALRLSPTYREAAANLKREMDSSR